MLRRDLRENNPIIRRAVAHTLATKTGVAVDPRKLELRMEPLSEHDFRAESNLRQQFGVSNDLAHKIIEAGCLAVGGLNQRLEYMQTYSAVTTFRESDLTLLDSRLASVVRAHEPSVHADRFRRVVSLCGFPDLGAAAAAGRVRLEKVLEISRSEECRRFRNWLWSVDSATDAQIREAFAGTRAKLVDLASGTTGKTLRWVASTGIGLLPGLGTIAGAAAGLIDSFLLDKILPKPAPISFLKTHYPSVFEDN